MPRAAQSHDLTLERMVRHTPRSDDGEDVLTERLALHIGARIRLRRLVLGMTQQCLATQTGVSYQQVQKYESGAATISISRMYFLAKALQVPVEFFFADFEQDTVRVTEHFQGPAHSNQSLRLMNALRKVSPEVERQLISLVETLSRA